MASLYLWVKALHIIAVISWMAGLFYLPRLFVYHTMAAPGSVQSETFKVMERKLLKIIMNPAMIVAWMFGIWLIFIGNSGHWLHVKLALVVALSGFHGFLSKLRKDFERDENRRPEKFFRMINEVPTLIMIAVVILAVVKPF